MRRDANLVRTGGSALLVLLLVLLQAATAAGQDRCGGDRADWLAMGAGSEGLGGTGLGGEGVGGTGLGGDPIEDGIGGTGHGGEGLGGTGLFGTITAFGSICVNGRRIQLDDQVPVNLLDEPRSMQVLRVGQVVWVVAQEDEEDGELRAESVTLLLAARGPIERVDPGRRRIQVGGRWVTLLDEVLVVDESSGLQLDARGLRVGEQVAVSGLEDGDQRIFATRIDRLDRADEGRVGLPDLAELARRDGVTYLSVEGFVSRPAADSLQLGSLTLELPPQSGRAASLEADTRVWVQGRAGATGLRAERIGLPPSRVRPPVAPPLPILRDLPRAAPPRPTDRENGRGRHAPSPGTPHAPSRGPQPRPEPGEGPIRIEPDIDRLQPVPGDVRGVLTR